MLVLSRKQDERLLIGDDIELVITKIHGNRVSIGFEAPKHIEIVRKELRVSRINSESSEASQPTTPKGTTLRAT